jgi:hypothetical protein
MEYLCAGEKHDVEIRLYVNNVRKIVVRKMTSSLASPFAVGNADTVSCTRRERNEVSPVIAREVLLCLDGV